MSRQPLHPTGVTMNEDTDYVHTAVINYEPTYFALQEAAEAWMDDQSGPRAPYRDQLRDAVEAAVRDDPDGIGLQDGDLTDDVDYGSMIDFELF